MAERIDGVKYFSKDVQYMNQKHPCPYCQTLLEKVKVSRVVHSDAPEAKEFDFHFSGMGPGNRRNFRGNIKFVWKEFECPNCKKHLTVEALKQLEDYRPSSRKVTNRWLTVLASAVFLLLFATVAAGILKIAGIIG